MLNLGHSWCSVVISVTFSSYLSYFKNNPKIPRKNVKSKIKKKLKVLKNFFKTRGKKNKLKKKNLFVGK